MDTELPEVIASTSRALPEDDSHSGLKTTSEFISSRDALAENPCLSLDLIEAANSAGRVKLRYDKEDGYKLPSAEVNQLVERLEKYENSKAKADLTRKKRFRELEKELKQIEFTVKKLSAEQKKLITETVSRIKADATSLSLADKGGFTSSGGCSSTSNALCQFPCLTDDMLAAAAEAGKLTWRWGSFMGSSFKKVLTKEVSDLAKKVRSYEGNEDPKAKTRLELNQNALEQAQATQKKLTSEYNRTLKVIIRHIYKK